MQCEVLLAKRVQPVRTAAFAYAMTPDGKRFAPLFRVVKHEPGAVEFCGRWVMETLDWENPRMKWRVDGEPADAVRIDGKALVIIAVTSERSSPKLRTAILDGKGIRPVRWRKHPIYAWRARRIMKASFEDDGDEGVEL